LADGLRITGFPQYLQTIDLFSLVPEILVLVEFMPVSPFHESKGIRGFECLAFPLAVAMIDV
tara:strand:- start:234 stop:419 length:186 start_codon:yes stop_codon:yes gene_type:complete